MQVIQSTTQITHKHVCACVFSITVHQYFHTGRILKLTIQSNTNNLIISQHMWHKWSTIKIIINIPIILFLKFQIYKNMNKYHFND